MSGIFRVNPSSRLWHTGRPSWFVNNPFEFTVAQLNETIIPVAVQSVIEGLGKNLTSWDVVNEPWYACI
jgi:GH35 family endo-1,4-beta-xylanase